MDAKKAHLDINLDILVTGVTNSSAINSAARIFQLFFTLLIIGRPS
jgi:hypothetical protein